MHSEFFITALIWALVFIFLIVYLWRRRQQGVGITATYLVFLAAGYWLQGAIYALPWYERMYPPETILSGFQMSLIALISLTFGVVVVAPFLRTQHRRMAPTVTSRKAGEAVSQERLHKITWAYTASGLLVYLVVAVVLGDVPTLGAFLGGIQRLYHVGILFLIWLTFTEVPLKKSRLLIIGSLIIIWPLFTITRDGFLGFGIIPITLLLIFPAFRFVKPRIVLVIAPVVILLGTSIIMTYFEGRNAIRNVAWSDATTDTRVTTLGEVFTTGFRIVNIFDPDQLAVIDLRFALNWLTGRGIERLESGVIPYANGETIRDAFLMVLPRFLWTDKPLVVGGQTLVNQYTGIFMYGATSVALGQVLEFYVNFGTLGVILGFALLGVLLSNIDRKVSILLRENSLFQAAVWIVPCFGLWLVEDNFITAVGGAVSAVIAVIAFNAGLRILFSLSKRETRYRQIVSTTTYEGSR